MYVPSDRVLIIDEDLNKRLATELRGRGRDAQAISALGLKGSEDPDLLRDLFGRFDDPVLITGDDHMPETHSELIAELSPTLAIVAPGEPNDPLEDAYEREIVHKWAHRMGEQPTGTLRRYHLSGPVRWTPRRR